jgi:integral membrane sensor domain MASE1
VAHAQDAVPIGTSLALFLGNAAQAVLAASIVLRCCTQPDCCQTPRGVTVFVVGAALIAPAAASLIPAAFYVGMAWANDLWSAWGMRTLTNAVTTLTVVPPLVAVFGNDHPALRGLTLARAGEFSAILLGPVIVDAASSALFAMPYVGLPPALYACLPFAIWAAIRFGIPGLATCLLLAANLIINSPFGTGLADRPMGAEAIVGVQMFVALAASSLMFLSVVREESRHIQRTEEALYHSEAKSAAILRALPDLMFVQSKDSDHRYLEYYARDQRDLLVSPETFVGKRMRDVLPPDLAQSFEQLFEQATSSAEPQILEYTLPMRGEERRFEARVVVCDDDRLLAIVRDVTEQKHAEAALQKADQALARMSQASALGQLAASIAHEVQQPLSAISTNAAACLRSLDDDAADVHQLTDALTDIMEDSRRAGP